MNDKIINQLANVKSNRPTLVTIYIPPRMPLFEIIAQLRMEIGTATNIHNQETREEATKTLGMVVEFLKQYDKVPLIKGLIIFCGYFPLEGNWEYRLFDFVPAEQVQVNMYRCDDHFWTNPLITN
jgi:peptide chain release factor subunit 1